MLHKYGCKKDSFDERDNLFTPRLRGDNPKTVNLAKYYNVPILDQGSLGSCVAHASSYAIQCIQKKQEQKKNYPVSRLFNYYNARSYEHEEQIDSGTSVRTMMKSLSHYGYFDEKHYPYDIKNFAKKPQKYLYDFAKNFKIVKYERVVQNELNLNTALSEGFVIVFGMSVFPCFEAIKNDGIMSMPNEKEKSLGGHCVACLGYDKDYYLIANSWGTSFGYNGYCLLPKEFVLNPYYCSDFWIIKEITERDVTIKKKKNTQCTLM